MKAREALTSFVPLPCCKISAAGWVSRSCLAPQDAARMQPVVLHSSAIHWKQLASACMLGTSSAMQAPAFCNPAESSERSTGCGRPLFPHPPWITGRPSKLSILGVQIFDKALTEVTFTELYAELCVQLSAALPGFEDLDEKSDGPKKLSVTFRRCTPLARQAHPRLRRPRPFMPSKRICMREAICCAPIVACLTSRNMCPHTCPCRWSCEVGAAARPATRPSLTCHAAGYCSTSVRRSLRRETTP